MNTRILHRPNNCPKKYFPDIFFWGGGGTTCPLPPPPTPMGLWSVGCFKIFRAVDFPS